MVLAQTALAFATIGEEIVGAVAAVPADTALTVATTVVETAVAAVAAVLAETVLAFPTTDADGCGPLGLNFLPAFSAASARLLRRVAGLRGMTTTSVSA